MTTWWFICIFSYLTTGFMVWAEHWYDKCHVDVKQQWCIKRKKGLLFRKGQAVTFLCIYIHHTNTLYTCWAYKKWERGGVYPQQQQQQVTGRDWPTLTEWWSKDEIQGVPKQNHRDLRRPSCLTINRTSAPGKKEIFLLLSICWQKYLKSGWRLDSKKRK